MFGALINHLWQSTLFAIVAGLVTIAFRKNRAQVRFWLWFSASLKFLAPFALLMALGGRLQWMPAVEKMSTQLAAPAASFTMVQIAEPFSGASPIAATTTGPRDWIFLAILIGWALGFAALALFRFRAWLRVRDAVRSSTLMDIRASVEVRSSPGLLEPGVVGLMRPILLVPEGIGERLPPPQLAAVLAHELCHTHRRDNLFAAIHMIAETVFWFHPLVWWIGARLVEERERACDEDVLRQGNDAQVYAEGILNICKLYVESPLVCVSGVTGADLRKRIEDIMTDRIVLRLNFAKKAALAVAGVVALAAPIVIGILNAPSGRAQSAAAATPKFEVASIKPCKAGDMPSGRKSAKGGGGRSASPGRLDVNCVTVNDLIQGAYGVFATGKQKRWVRPFPVEGAPGWINSERYSIDAKPESPQGRAMMLGPLMRALLEDRFKLRVRSETREVPVYVLTVAKGGPKNLQAAKEGACVTLDLDHLQPPPEHGPFIPFCGLFGRRGGAVLIRSTTMANLSEQFSALLDRDVIDKTGIAGVFDIQFEMSSEDLASGTADSPAPTRPDDESELIFAAVRKLGMKLEAAKGPGKFLVIDHVERPTEN